MNIQSIIDQSQDNRKSREHTDDHTTLIGRSGYVSPIENLWNDILLSVVLQKNVLLKGPSGSGKTKLAESISSFFNQPMHSINCSVDLDAEALLGFKTLIQENGQTAIDFVEGPVIQAMRYGHILYIDEINMAKPETLPILHSVLDHRRMLTNPYTGEVLRAHVCKLTFKFSCTHTIFVRKIFFHIDSILFIHHFIQTFMTHHHCF